MTTITTLEELDAAKPGTIITMHGNGREWTKNVSGDWRSQRVTGGYTVNPSRLLVDFLPATIDRDPSGEGDPGVIERTVMEGPDPDRTAAWYITEAEKHLRAADELAGVGDPTGRLLAATANANIAAAMIAQDQQHLLARLADELFEVTRSPRWPF